MSKPILTPYQDGITSPQHSRADIIRRDNDVVKVPKVTLFDHDFAVYYHLTENLKLEVTENDATIPVPVMFANGEKWSQIRQHGYLRGSDKKVMAPLIIIRRTDIADDDRIPILGLNNAGGTFRIVPYRNTSMQWDRVAGQYLKKDTVETYMYDTPTYVKITYELIIWTDLQEQMNHVIHPIIGANDHVWGDVLTFRMAFQSITPDNVNVPGEDRLVKTTMTFQMDGYLRAEYDYHKSKIQKQYSVKTVKFLQEGTEEVIFNTNDPYPLSQHREEISTQNKDTIKAEEENNLRKIIRR